MRALITALGAMRGNGKTHAKTSPRPAGLRRLRIQTLALVLGVNVFLAVTMGLFLGDAWRETLARAQRDVENLNLMLSGDLEAQFSRIDFCLLRIVDAFDDPSTHSVDDLQPLVDREAGLLLGINGVRVIDAEGNLRVASGGRLDLATNIADQERFRVARDNPDRGLFVSRAEWGRQDRQWMFTISRRLVGADGSFGGEVYATVPLVTIEYLFSQLKMPPHGVVSLWNGEPQMIARVPAPTERDRSLTTPPSPELRSILSNNFTSALYETSKGTDGVPRYYFARKLSGLPLYVTVGAAKQDVFADWMRQASQFGVLYLLFAAATIAGGAMLHARASSRLIADAQLRVAALVYDNSAQAMIVLDPQGNVISVNNAFVELTGRARETVIGMSASEMPGYNIARAQIASITRATKAKGHWIGDIWTARASGERFLAHTSITLVRDEPVGAPRSVVMFSDITEQKKAEETVWRHANLDPLTLLPNRRRFRERLEEEIERAQASGESFGLIFIDLDRFKDINDSLGHHSGDLLLKEAAARVGATVREGDVVARLGGDEFTVLAVNLADVIVLERAAQRIVAVLSAPFVLGDETCFVSASVGVTVFPRDALNANDLLSGADMAMYEAKRDGRNKYKFFTARMHKALTERAELVRDLRSAVEHRQFELHYQPIVTMATGTVGKAEALIRWRHPTRGLVSPAEFISLAEETGLIVEIGAWVFQQAARQLAAWRRDYDASSLCVCVNASPLQFSAVARRMLTLPQLLAHHGLSGADIVIEITEGALLGASEETKGLIAALRAQGVRFALDDFGTGYSSLAYLRQFDIGFLKIDKAFIDGLAEGGSDLAICEAIIVMSRRLGIAVIAEGIETHAQRQLLSDAGCEYGQGYLFAKPLPADRFAAEYLKPREAAGAVAA